MGKKVLTLRMNELDDKYDPTQTTEVTVHLSDEVAWDKMMPYFFHFLEGAGYLGVVDRMTNLLGGDVYDYKTYINASFNGEPFDE
jgi:hypothetical protein